MKICYWLRVQSKIIFSLARWKASELSLHDKRWTYCQVVWSVWLLFLSTFVAKTGLRSLIKVDSYLLIDRNWELNQFRTLACRDSKKYFLIFWVSNPWQCQTFCILNLLLFCNFLNVQDNLNLLSWNNLEKSLQLSHLQEVKLCGYYQAVQ